MSRRRPRTRASGLLVRVALSWVLWAAITRLLGGSDVVAALVVGVVWGLVAGWRLRGRVEAAIRRLINRALYRVGYRVVLSGRRGRR